MVLDGTYSNLELSFLEQKLLDHCKKERNADIIGKEITVAEWKDKIWVWKEKTTTSPSGKHLGHYKALLSRGSDDPQLIEGKEFASKQKKLVQVHVDMLNYAIRY
eukprot:6572687-Ditylum_brightwellii.AAC.1